MINDSVKDGLCPGGSSANLFQDHWGHSPVQCLQAVAISLAVCLAFGLLFSEKFLGYIEFWTYSVDFDIQPRFRPLGFNDVYVCSMDESDTARGKLAVSHDLIRNKHGLFSGGCEASLPGRFGNQICVWRPLVQHAACLPKESRICVHCLPFGAVLPHLCPVPGAGYPNLWHKPSQNTGSSRVVSHLPGKQWSHSPWPW